VGVATICVQLLKSGKMWKRVEYTAAFRAVLVQSSMDPGSPHNSTFTNEMKYWLILVVSASGSLSNLSMSGEKNSKLKLHAPKLAAMKIV